MLHMLRLITACLFLMSLFWSGYSKAEENSSMPAISKDIPGVDTEKLQQDVEKLLQKVRETQKKKKSCTSCAANPLPISKEQTTEGKKAADKAMEGFNSKKNQDKLREAKARVQERIASRASQAGASLLIQPQAAPLQQNASKDKVYVFLSSSMPEEAVNACIAQAARYGDGRIIPVFYGFPGGLANKRAAGSYFAHMMQESLACKDTQDLRCPRSRIRMKVNPALFQQYGITRVPTVVYTNGEDSWALGGDATLGYLLEKINGEARSPFLAQVIKKIEGN
jgi:type-F conjugative transfer system pilin assembly protein TrbC